MATSFFGGAFFGGEFFSGDSGVAVVEEATRPRPDDGGGRRKTLKAKGRPIFKPTGLIDRPRTIEERLEQTAEIAREVFGQARAPVEAPVEPPISQMTLAEVEREIGVLLRKKVRTEEDELILLLLMAASAAG